MTVLGVDWGEKHTGLALGWTGIGLSQPLTTVNTAAAVAKILSICKAESIGKIIIGISEAESGRKAKTFAAKLKSLSIPIEFSDETLSTKDAQNYIIAIKKRHRQNHATAAAVILEHWME